MYPWHGSLHPPPQPPPPTHTMPQTAAATPSSTTPYQMPSQLRWLPSMISRSQHQPQQAHHPQHQHQHHQHQPSQTATATLPTISSNLRMAQNSNHQPVSVVVEPRPQRRAAQHQHSSAAAVAAAGGVGPRSEDPMDDEGSDESDHSSRDIVVLDAPGDTIDASGNGNSGGLATTTAGRQPDEDDEDGAANNTYLNFHVDQPAPPGTTTAAGTDAAAGADSRKHGKRLTTKEEVSLFDICNRHALEFGQRSNLCKWWNTVTTEFTHDQGHPYSWHSVRRKVEMVTKQRMKFLEELREKNAAAAANDTAAGEDLSNPRWRAAIDAWIPTWQRWEEAEAKRIEKRDSRKTRKRKSRPWEFTGWDSVDVGASGASSPVETTPLSTPQHQNQNQGQSQSQSQSQAQVQAQGQVKLPPGFDSMFSNPNPPQASHTRKSSTTTFSYRRTPPALPVQTTPTPGPAPMPGATGTGTGTSTEKNMMTALLDTLGKLNKHLDTANPPETSVPSSSAFVSQAQSQSQPRSRSQGTPRTNDNPNNNNIINNNSGDMSLHTLKEELRREMREEFRREIEQDRASLEEKLDSVQRTQEMILEMLRQEPA